MTSPLQQKLKVSGPVVITANRLVDGAVVYWTQDNRWSTRLDEAAIATSAGAATRILTEANADDLEAVGAYVAPVERKAGGGVHPANLREKIRLGGPTFALPATQDLVEHVRNFSDVSL